jgi:large subunit ribosomal protein L28
MASGACDVCDKHLVFGRNIRHKHSGNWERKAPRTSRTFAPNVQKRRMFVNGAWKRINVCTRCMRTEVKRLEAKGVPQGMATKA